MADAVIMALLLALPLVVSGAYHMWVVRRNHFAWLAIPLHRRWFGPNKTWRGMVVMLLATIPGVWLAQWLEPWLSLRLLTSLRDQNAVILGLLLGLGYVLPELPNSYVKRRLHIRPGERPAKWAPLSGFIDQADSAFGCALVYALVLAPPLLVILWMVMLGPLIHLLANLSLFGLGLRKQPF